MGKFADKEIARRSSAVENKSAAKKMAGQKNSEKKLVSFKASEEMYQQFAYINSLRGVSNTAMINMLIADYVREHSDML